MPRRLVSLLLLLAANITLAQVASYTSASGLLVVPALQVDGQTLFSNVKLSIAANGTWNVLSADNGPPAASANSYPLHTSISNYPKTTGIKNASATFALANGQLWRGCDNLPVTDDHSVGAVPVANPSNPNIAIFKLSDGTFLLQLDGTQSTCAPTPLNQVITSGGAASASGGSSTAPVTSLSVTPATMSGNAGEQMNFVVVGGTPPYQAVSSNPGFAQLLTFQSDATHARALGSFAINGSAQAGSLIMITDAANATAQLTVSPATAVAITVPPLAISPSAVSGRPGSDIAIAIAGGTPPYSATTSNPGVVSITGVTTNNAVPSGVVNVKLVAYSGQGTIAVTDAAGAIASATVTVQ